jgi:PKD repeat protein
MTRPKTRTVVLVAACLGLWAPKPAAQLVPEFSADVVLGPAPLHVTFTDESTGGADVVTWNFGDGGLGLGSEAFHSFTEPGSYDVKLTITQLGLGSESLIKRGFITVEPDQMGPHVATFTSDVETGDNPLVVQFADLTPGSPTQWLWRFGDGAESSEQNPSHTYGLGGPYTVTLHTWGFPVPADGFSTSVKTDLISVEPAQKGPFTVDFTASVTSGIGTQAVTFTGASDPEPWLWQWDLGDGTTATGPSVTHTYDTTLSSYDVMLTVSMDAEPGVVQKTGAVQMAPSTPWLSEHLIDSDPTEKLLALDVDGDGDEDLLASTPFDAWMLFRQTGDPFSLLVHEPSSLPSTARGDLEAADLDMDGDIDLALGLSSPSSLTWWDNTDGLGTYQELMPLPGGGEGPHALGDLDGDGDPDLIAGPTLNLTVVYRNEPTLSQFHPLGGLGVFSGSTSQDYPLVDLDGDGALDVGWAATTTDKVGWAHNDLGNGTHFTGYELAVEPSGEAFLDFEFRDVDQDGQQDLITVDSNGDVSWYASVGQVSGVQAGIPLIPNPPLGVTIRNLNPLDVDYDGDVDLLFDTSGIWGAAWLENLDGQGSYSGLMLAPEQFHHATEHAVMMTVDDSLPLDLVTSGVLRWWRYGPSGTWGSASPLVQEDELDMRLFGLGIVAKWTTTTLAVEGLPPGSPAWFVLGTSAVNAPFSGGVLVPQPEVVFGFVGGANGIQVLSASWPGGTPLGLDVYIQVWAKDGTTPSGWVGSNAIHEVSLDY